MEPSIFIPYGLLAGITQLVGYLFYIKLTGSDDISPNPTTWIIFTFDTALLVFLEFVAGASLNLLLLPGLCTVCSLYIAWLVRRSGRLTWPKDNIDRYVLVTAIFVCLSYSSIFAFWYYELVPFSYLIYLNSAFLILSNLNTFVAFIPIIREVFYSPEHEKALPWFIWALAYWLLISATRQEVGYSDVHTMLLYLYPIIGFTLHASIAVLAIDRRK